VAIRKERLMKKLIKRFFLKMLRYSVLDTKEKTCKRYYPNCEGCPHYTEYDHHCLPINVWKGLIDLGYKL
jgi:hypothetical protein